MRTYWLLTGLMMVLFLALFGLFEALDVPLLTDPQPFFERAGLLGTAAIGIGLLVIDIFLPVPASLVMVAHGALFGVTLGTLVSLVGGVLASAVGFAVGRWGGPLLHRLVPASERQRADELLSRWGDLAVVVSRPVPILAESLSILAGTSPLSWRRFLVASALGNLPPALLYALTGATAARLDNAFLMFGLVLLVAALVSLAGQRFRSKTTPRALSDPAADEPSP